MATFLKQYNQYTHAKENKKKVFDWDKAITLILDNNLSNCAAGLHSDYNNTFGLILKDGEPYYNYCYLSSYWDLPVLYDCDGKKEYECWNLSEDCPYDENSEWTDELKQKLTKGKHGK